MDEKALSGAGLFDNIDLVFSQQIFNEKFGIFHTKNLKKICIEKGIRFVHMFNAYFEGYYPCVIHVPDIVISKHRVPISQDAIVFYSFTKGLEIDAACKLWKTISSSSAMKDFSRKTCAASIKELVRREKNMDVKSSVLHFFLKNYRRRRLMHSLNHPTNEFLKETVQILLQTMGIEEDVLLPENELLGWISYPTMNAVRDALGLSYESDDGFVVLGMRKDLPEYIEFLYDFYRSEPGIVEKNISLQARKLHSIDTLVQSL